MVKKELNHGVRFGEPLPLKIWLLGTHHGVSHQHLPAYLNEFVFRFNRRFYPMTAFNAVLGLASHAAAPTYETLYSGEWTHPIA